MRTLQDIQPGQTLGRYEFLIPIAEGGMASVWAARLKGSRGFSKNVAVKTMLPNVSDDPAFEQMFLDEAEIASRIRHPNVVQIMDLGEQDEVLYLVMEWVDGEPLASLRRRAAKNGGIPRDIAVRLVADACAGLHAAHELKDEAGVLLGLVHRDISPQNILITYDGVVKIVDFGVAKAAGRSSEATSAGQVKGKPPYMSPEQALGEVVDRRTDIFALGIILYQLTTGKHPFRGESDLVTLQNIVSDKPVVPPRAYDKAFPRTLDTVIMKALERNRDRRFQTCADFEAALDEVFARELTRARTEDVGRFVTQMLGHKREQRRSALRDAIVLADERAAGRISLSDVDSMDGRPSIPSTYGTPVSSPSRSSRMSVITATGAIRAAPTTPFAAMVAPPADGGRSKTGLVMAVAALALLVVGGVALAMVNGSGETASEAAAPAVNTAPEPLPFVEPEAEPQVLAVEPVGGADADIAADNRPAPTETPAPAVTARAIRPQSRWRPPKSKSKPVERAAAKPAPKKATVKRSSGFVPPPMPDPGF